MGAASGRFWRLRLPDGFICRKMELYDDAGKAVVVFTQGRSGNYAMAMGKWGRVSEILPLWYFDDIAGALTTLRLAWPASRSGPSITKAATPRNRGLGIYDAPAYEHGWLSQFLDWLLSEENTGRMALGTGILAIV